MDLWSRRLALRVWGMKEVYVNLSRVASLPADASEPHVHAASVYDAHVAAAAAALDEFHEALRHHLVAGSPADIERVVQASAAGAAAWGATSFASWILEWFRDYTYAEASLAAMEQRDYRQRMHEDA